MSSTPTSTPTLAAIEASIPVLSERLKAHQFGAGPWVGYIGNLHYARPSLGDVWVSVHDGTEVTILAVSKAGAPQWEARVVPLSYPAESITGHVQSTMYYPKGAVLDSRTQLYVPAGYGYGDKGFERVPDLAAVKPTEVNGNVAPSPSTTKKAA